MSVPETQYGGANLGVLACEVTRHGAVANSGRSAGASARRIPPSVTYESTAVLALRLDRWFPPSPIGIGDEWPLPARVDFERPARMPIALLWRAVRDAKRWRPQENVEVDPLEALAAAAAQSLEERSEDFAAVGLAVPNWLKQAEQQRLLDALSGSGASWRLVWRPVAAATSWLERHAAELRVDGAPRSRLGRIVHLHLSLSDCEATALDLVLDRPGHPIGIVPARCRPNPSREWRPGLMNESLLALAREASDKDQAALWRTLWATPWLIDQIRSWRGDRIDAGRRTVPVRFSPQPSASPRVAHLAREKVPAILREEFEPSAAREWVAALLRESGELSGAVVTGELAAVAPGGQSLARTLLANSNLTPRQILVEGEEDDVDLLARGAALQAWRAGARQPTFLDTLPRLRTMVSRAGEPDWIPLLGEEGSFVEGGKRWARPEPVFGLRIPGSREMRLALEHEDFDGVREARVRVPDDVETGRPAELHVSVTPAQGNAVVEVRPSSGAVRRSPMHVDWSRMEDAQASAEAYAAKQPRIAPPILPRLHSPAKWRKVLEELKRAPKPIAKWDLETLRSVQVALRDKDGTMYPRNATAVGSERDVGVHQEMLDLLESGLWRIFNKEDERRETATRALAYMSSDREPLLMHLGHVVATRRIYADPECRLVGNCLRSPHAIADYLSALSRGGVSGPEISPGNVRTIAELCCYRSQALQSVTSESLSLLYEMILIDFENVSRSSHLRLDFRNLTLAMAFLLRRRVFDDSFVPPDSELAERAKTVCANVIDRARRGRVYVMGGSVDLPAVMKQLIDYVDRRGQGAFLMSDA
jgi:hypothetical protein